MKTDKKILSVFLSLLMVLPLLGTAAFPASAAGLGGECGVEGDNLTWTVENQETLRISGVGAMQDYVFPNGTQTTGISPFCKMNDIRRIIVDEGVTSIGDCAFVNDVYVTEISLPSTLKSIGAGAFDGCNMTEIDLPEGLETIGPGAFAMSSIEILRIPASVVSIGPGQISLENCVKEILVDEANPAYTSVDGVLFTKDMKTLCAYPNDKKIERYSVPDGVERIEENAFWNPTDLKLLYLPLSVTELAQHSMKFYDYLTDLYYAGTEDQWNALIGGDPHVCSADQATLHFEADGLPPVEVVEPQTVFTGSCGENVTWTLDRTTRSLTLSGTGATYDYNIESIFWDEYGLEAECDSPFEQHKSYIQSIVIEDGVTSIGKALFADCYCVRTVEIPASVTSIGDCAFCGCYQMKMSRLPDSLESIGNEAFSYCLSLDSSILLPTSLRSIGEHPFPRKVVLLYTGTEAQWNELTDGLAHADEITVVCNYVPGDPVPTVAVESGSCGDGVVWTMYNNGLFEISGKGAMDDFYCYVADDGGDVTNTQPYDQYIHSVKRIVVRSGVTSVGECAFYFSRAEEIVIEEGVESIARCAFGDNPNLKSIRLPASLKNIDAAVFWDTPIQEIWFAGTEAQWNALTKNKRIFDGDFYYEYYLEHPVIMHYAEEAPSENPTEEPTQQQVSSFMQFIQKIADFFKKIADFFRNLFSK